MTKKCYLCAHLKLKRVIVALGDWRFGFYIEHYCNKRKIDVRLRKIDNCKLFKPKLKASLENKNKV